MFFKKWMRDQLENRKKRVYSLEISDKNSIDDFDQFVRVCYESILQRFAQQEEVNHYVSLMKQNFSHFQVMRTLLDSSEYSAKKRVTLIDAANKKLTLEELQSCYQVFLSRNPSSDEVQNILENIANIDELKEKIVWSKEFKQKNPNFSPSNQTAHIWKSIGQESKLLLNLDDRVVSVPIFNNEYKIKEKDLIEKLVHPNDHVLDIGAHTGFFTLLMAEKIGSQGKVYSYEPHPQLFSYLSQSIEKNKKKNIVEMKSVGLGSKKQSIEIAFNLFGEAYDLSINDMNNKSVESSFYLDEKCVEKIEFAPIDSLNFETNISFVKIDANGFEGDIVEGASRFLRTHKPTLLVTLNKKKLEKNSRISTRELVNKLERLGFEAFSLDLYPEQVITDSRKMCESVVFKPFSH